MLSVGALSPSAGDRLLGGSQGAMMCCEMQSECSGRATLAPRGRRGGEGTSQQQVARRPLRSGRPVTGSRLSMCTAEDLERLGSRQQWQQQRQVEPGLGNWSSAGAAWFGKVEVASRGWAAGEGQGGSGGQGLLRCWQKI